MKISYNALTGNIETLNEFEGNGPIHKAVRPEREPLQDIYESQDWLFMHDMSEDIAAQVRQEEAFVKRLELTSYMSDDNTGYRIKWGAETNLDVYNSDETNYETL